MRKVTIIDDNLDTAELFQLGISKYVEADVSILLGAAALTGDQPGNAADVFIINHETGEDVFQLFSECSSIKEHYPERIIIIFTAPGAAFNQFTVLQKKTDAIDTVLQKPIEFSRFAEIVHRLFAELDIKESFSLAS